jgi:histidinol phosphatase-like enzyme/predicted kinase
VHSVVRAHAIRLTDEDRELFDRHFPGGRTFRSGSRIATAATRAGEVVMIMGLPGAGKSKLAHGFASEGYVRLNRDDAGGALRDLLPSLESELNADHPRVVLDNTYVTRKSRAEVIRVASERGVPVRCVWLTTSVDEAQVNAAARILRKYGRLPDDAELARLRKQDVSAFLPTVQFRYHRELEPPDPSEGFAQIDRVPFVREHDPGHVNHAMIVWLDQPAIDDTLAAELRAKQKKGWKILGLSWQPGIEAGTTSRADVDAQFARLRDQTGVDIDIEYCPHGAGPPRCWCRKPLPGLGVLLIHRHQLDPQRCVYVGSGAADPGFARKLGFAYRRHDPG